MSVKIDIITCPQWGARKPKGHLITVPMASRVILHHTVSHVRQIDNPKVESEAEAIRYAKEIQNFHMDGNGWVDSGHNFLVTRGGHILQGRWLTVSAIQADHMVLSAHCPGQNGQIGIECEHLGNEKMTKAQHDSFARIVAWASWKYNKKAPLPIQPHRMYYATACPANLVTEIPSLTRKAVEYMQGV